MGPGCGTLGESIVFLRASRLLVAVLACLLVGLATPSYADHRPNHAGGGHGKPDSPGKPDNPGKPDKPGKPGQPGGPGEYAASLLTTLLVTVQDAVAGVVDPDGSAVVLVEVLSDAVADSDGALSLDGLVQLRAGDALLGSEPVRDGVATFEVPAARLGQGDVELTARFVPDAGTPLAASEATEAVTVGECDACADDAVALAAADRLPAQSDPTLRWMGLAAFVLLAGGALLWLLAGGPSRRLSRRR